jgi:hypothetical protein
MSASKQNRPEETGNNADFIYIVDEAMPDVLCDQLVATINAHPGARPGIVGTGLDKAKKHSLDLTLDRFDELRELRQSVVNVVIENITDYFVRYPFVGSVHPVIRDKATGKTTEITLYDIAEYPRDFIQMCVKRMFRFGEINVQKYRQGIGGYLHWHAEIWREENFEALHRIVTWLYYLNDVDEGGETEFFFQNRKAKPKKGTCVIAPSGFTHTHRGCIPLSGDKYIATSWLLYDRPDRTKASR